MRDRKHWRLTADFTGDADGYPRGPVQLPDVDFDGICEWLGAGFLESISFGRAEEPPAFTRADIARLLQEVDRSTPTLYCDEVTARAVETTVPYPKVVCSELVPPGMAILVSPIGDLPAFITGLAT